MAFDLNEREALELQSLKQLEYFVVLERVASYSYSELGKELILQSYPNRNVNELNKEHTFIQEATQVIVKEDQIPFEGLNDIKSKLHKSKIANSTLNTAELLSVKDTIRTFRLLKQFFSIKETDYSNLYELTRGLFDNRMLEKHIEEAIDLSGEVKDNATKELARIRKDIREHGARLRNRLEKILKKNVEDEMVQDDFYSIREGRFVLPIKSHNKNKIGGIIHGISNTGSTVFIEPTEIIELNNELSILQNEELREIHKILTNLTNEVGQEADKFLYSIQIAAHLDSIFGKARYALEFGGFKPTITDDDNLSFEKIYHPLLLNSNNRKSIIPLSISFTKKKLGVLISGPNAGGKTVALKSIGLNLALALSGIFPIGNVVASYHRVFTSIGDNQSIENNLSTFSSQLKQLKGIIDNSDSDTLVLIDEICSGTDPQEGSALASGVMDKFISKKLNFVITTHQSSLKTYALNKSEIENASLEFNTTTFKPSYKFLTGVPGNSYAFHLAEAIGFDKKLLEDSKSYLGDKANQLEESIAMLTQYRNEALEQKISADKLKLEFENLKKDYEIRLKEVKEKKLELIKSAQVEAGEIVKNANKLVENTIRELKEEQRSSSEIKKDFEAKKHEILEIVEEFTKEEPVYSDKALEVGTNVTIDDNNQEGTIIEIDNDNALALVEFNGLKFKVKLAKLKAIESKEVKKKYTTKHTSNFKLDTSTRLDLRGMRADEAIKEIDNTISNALLSNLPFLTVIHGKGTGALRQAIQNHLRKHGTVKSFRDGELVEGGAGVTVINL
jgi:DNA mismatch repair protein MutS2